MSFSFSTFLVPGGAPTFSGHETFALRSNWLKKAYDLLCARPDLFSGDTAFVQLGVGKNMAQSIRSKLMSRFRYFSTGFQSLHFEQTLPG